MTQQQTMQAILDKIIAYDTIIITRHVRPDGDAIGSSNGLAEIIRASFPHKKVYVQTEDSSDYLAFLNGDDQPISDDEYNGALLIVLDTATRDRISNSKYDLAKEVIKIDHHIDIKPYGDLCWIEDYRSSTCEMVAYFYSTFKDKLALNKRAALFVYTGMVTDSGRFRYESTTGETLRLAGMLLDEGVNTDWLFANLYLADFEYYKFQAYVHKKMKTTVEGSLETLKELIPVLEAINDWQEENIHSALMQYIADKGVKNGIVLWPLRTALSGKMSTPGGATEIAYIIGKDETLARVNKAVNFIQESL